jgi:hypothetical protein
VAAYGLVNARHNLLSATAQVNRTIVPGPVCAGQVPWCHQAACRSTASAAALIGRATMQTPIPSFRDRCPTLREVPACRFLRDRVHSHRHDRAHGPA